MPDLDAPHGPPDPAEPEPTVAPEAPIAPAPAWDKAYELPGARKVVSAGLQLAAESSSAIRRASIYIGLLTLGAFGPTLVLLLLGIGRLLSDPATATTIAEDPSLLFLEQPAIEGALQYISMLVAIGLVLLIAISIDAQAIALALLGGVAADRPLLLREAIVRARQVFWRLAGAGVLVGITSAIVTFVVTVPFLRPFDSNTGIRFIGSIIGAIAVVPFAFAGAGIVLGDVGPIEALKRSTRLFRARPRVALVVVLFTLVTSTIQAFALGAGLDAAVRVAEFLHLGLDQGGVSLVLSVVLVLAFVVAFGSLSFTVAAIVAAPQVAAFLGLTFHSAGLDRARLDGPALRRKGRWLTFPMLAALVALSLLAVIGLPVIYSTALP
jgi:hypothetical protein